MIKVNFWILSHTTTIQTKSSQSISLRIHFNVTISDFQFHYRLWMPHSKKPCTEDINWLFHCILFHCIDDTALTSWWKNFALAGSNLMATVTVLNTMWRRWSTWDTGISSQGGDGSAQRHPSIDTKTLITYTKPPTFRNTVRVLWLSRRHINNDCSKNKQI
jgi:hypothetical protein